MQHAVATASASCRGDGSAGSGNAKRDRSGSSTGASSGTSCVVASRHTKTGPFGSVIAIWCARTRASSAAGTEAGWLSHFV